MKSSVDEALFLLLVAVLPVMQPFNVAIGPYTLPIADFLFPIVVVAFTVALLMRRKSLSLDRWQGAVLAYLGACVVATVWSENVRVSVVKLAGMAYLCGLSLLTVQYVRSAEALRRVLYAWLAGTAITLAAMLAGVVLFALGIRSSANIFLYSFGSLPPGAYPRVMALFLNANMFCTYVVASATIVLAMWKAGWIDRRAGGILFAGTLLATGLSFSAVAGGLVLALAFWYARAIRDRMPGVARLCLVAGWAGAVLFLAATTISPADGGGPSSRVMTWTDAWHTFLANPWVGRGLGLEVADVRYLNASGLREHLTDAHNVYLSVLAQEGLLGAAAFALVLGTLVWRFQPIAVAGPPVRVVRTGLELAFVAGFLYAGLTGAFEDTRHLWVLMGLVAAMQSGRISGADDGAARGTAAETRGESRRP